VGTTYCPKAVTETRSLHDLLLPIVTQDKYRSVDKKVLINITGCPNSCSPYRIVDIGFRGMRIREAEIGSVEGYEMLLGGDQRAFGQKLGEFKKTDCPEIVESVLDTFLKVRNADETLTQTVARLGLEPFQQAVFQ
jgi:sulfite reductase (NADPH) hemoprotein beta-component